MKFSVIIPLYNGAKTIEATLDSVIAQTYRDYEIVLVNDESPDNIGDVVKEYIKKYSDVRFIYIEQRNKGLGGARNTAIRNSTGEICSFIDQDDIWYPTKLETVLKIFEKFPHVSVVCHGAYVRKNGAIVDCAGISTKQSPLHRDLLFGGNPLVGSATSVMRRALEDVGCFSEDIQNLHFAEDFDLWMNLSLKGYSFYFVNDFLSEYIVHGTNYSSGSVKKMEFMYRSGLFVLLKHYKLMATRMPLDWYRIRTAKADMLILYAYNFILHNHDPAKFVLYLAKAFFCDPILFLRVPIKILGFIKRKSMLSRLARDFKSTPLLSQR